METDFKPKFKVRVGEFEGPLPLLLDLVERRKLHINTVSLSQVADDFIEHLKNLEQFPMADSADFILIASTLVLIKSKSLLPNLNLTREEEMGVLDLEERLRQYKKYKELSLCIQKMLGNSLFFAQESKSRPVIFTPTRELDTGSLYAALSAVLQNIPKPSTLPKATVEKVMSLEEMILDLAKRVEQSFKISFKDFSDKGGGSTSRVHKISVIVSFLAMLELVKRGAIRVRQENHFEDIEVESEYLGVPKY